MYTNDCNELIIAREAMIDNIARLEGELALYRQKYEDIEQALAECEALDEEAE